MQPGGHGAGGERTKLGRAGQGVHPPAQSPMLCELEPVMEEKSRWRVLGDQFSPYHHLPVRKSEEPENSNLEFDLPGHYKGAFVKVGHWEVLRFITRVYLDMWEMDVHVSSFPGPADVSSGWEWAAGDLHSFLLAA